MAERAKIVPKVAPRYEIEPSIGQKGLIPDKKVTLQLPQ